MPNPNPLYSILLLTFLYSQAFSTTYYVDPSGSDSQSGTSPTSAWQSVDKVNSTSFSAGDSILFKRGEVWNEGLETTSSGSAESTVTVTYTVMDTTIHIEFIDPSSNNAIYYGAYGSGAKPKFDMGGSGKAFKVLHDYIVIENLHLHDGGNGILAFDKSSGNHWVNIKGLDMTQIDGNVVRIYNGGSHLWFDSVYIFDYRVNGIYISGSPSHHLEHVLIENCHIEDPTVYDKEDAIACHDNSSGDDIEGYVLIRNNTIIKSGEDGIDLTSGHHILVEGNYIEEAYQAGVMSSYPESSHHLEIRSNYIVNCDQKKSYGSLALRTGYTRAVNNIVVTPYHHIISVNDNTGPIQYWNNVFVPLSGFTGRPVYFGSSPAGMVEFRNNIFDLTETSKKIGGSGWDETLVDFDYNFYFTSSASQTIMESSDFLDMRSTYGFEINGMNTDPMYMDPSKSKPEDFQLLSSSPCIDAGTLISIDEDYFGNYRTIGASTDIGCYEYSDIPTSMQQPIGENQTKKSPIKGVFNLQGQKLSAPPLSGVFIQDGQVFYRNIK